MLINSRPVPVFPGARGEAKNLSALCIPRLFSLRPLIEPPRGLSDWRTPLGVRVCWAPRYNNRPQRGMLFFCFLLSRIVLSLKYQTRLACGVRVSPWLLTLPRTAPVGGGTLREVQEVRISRVGGLVRKKCSRFVVCLLGWPR